MDIYLLLKDFQGPQRVFLTTEMLNWLIQTTRKYQNLMGVFFKSKPVIAYMRKLSYWNFTQCNTIFIFFMDLCSQLFPLWKAAHFVLFWMIVHQFLYLSWWCFVGVFCFSLSCNTLSESFWFAHCVFWPGLYMFSTHQHVFYLFLIYLIVLGVFLFCFLNP